MALVFSFITSSRRGSNHKTNSKNTTPVKKLTGVVFIDKLAKYTIKIANSTKTIEYDIAPQCFTCKGKNKVWTFQKNNKRLLVLFRSELHLHQLNYRYKPFAPGSLVIGHLIKDINKNDIFYIDEICDTNDINLSNEARRFYYDNWEEIHNMYEKRYGNEN
jgi:hypothetical protein